MLQAPSGERPEMLAAIWNAQDSPTTKNCPAPNVSANAGKRRVRFMNDLGDAKVLFFHTKEKIIYFINK